MQKIIGASLLALSFVSLTAVHAGPPLAIEETGTGYRIRMILPDPVVEKMAVHTLSSDGRAVNDTFVKVSLYGFDYHGAVGDPAMLSGQFNLALEQGVPRISVEDLVTETVALGGKLYPVQPPCCYCGKHEPPAFVYHPGSYTRTVKGDPVAVTAAYTYRGQKAATITVEPMRYDPETNTVVVVKRMTVSVVMEKPASVRSFHSREFDRIMRTLFVNLEGVPSEAFSAREKYLIVAEPAYLQNADLQRLVTFRSAHYDVKLVGTSAVGGTTKEAYRAYIYNQERPAFCLLVGSSFPSWETSAWWSLNYYAASQVSSSSSKPLPGIALGLFWVTGASQLTTIVNKTIQTESTLSTRIKMVYGQGGCDEPIAWFPADHADRLIEEVNNKYFTAVTGFQVINRPSTSDGAQRAIELFNQGCWFNIFFGHGSTVGQAFGWETSNLSSMRNSQYPFVLSCACLTGTYNRNCVAAASVAHQYGPVTYIGSNGNSGLGQHVLIQGYVAAIMNKKITKNGLAYIYGVNYDTMPHTTGQYVQPSTGDKAAMGWQYHHFGDPAIPTMPTNVSVTAPRDVLAKNPAIAVRGNTLCMTLSRRSAAAPVQAAIYTMQGRLVKTLVHATAESGGTSLPLGPVTPGLYLITVTYEGITQTIPCPLGGR
ncbi:MAG: hypothetical protein JXA71_12395 [Chitinispirillaceae bacterium]|nr:hypothetical protein [Chitinispirillaceae bacterium]